MSDIEVNNLMSKFLTHQASAEELDMLVEWLQDIQNEKLFQSYVQTNYAIEHEIRKFDGKTLKSKLQQLIETEKKTFRLKKRRKIMGYAAAAVVSGLLVSSYLFKDNFLSNSIDTNSDVVRSIHIGSDKATLTLEDGAEVVLEKGSTYQTQNSISNGEDIVYEAGKNNIKKEVYNYLTVPRGGQFHLILSDGTEVWLNSESQFKYPVNFLEGETRKVNLVYGEGYFAVSPSTEHGGSKFIVSNQSQEIEVMGTEFNVKAYREETHIYTTLVEGKVAINTTDGKRILKPSQQANLNLSDDSIDLATVDVYNEISWKDGVFSFRRKPLGEIMKVLSRWYDMDVNFQNPQLEKAGFNGVLDKNQNIEDILDTIKNFGIIKDYEIKNKTILLK